MRVPIIMSAAMVLCIAAHCNATPAIGEQCVTDLETIPDFLLENDAGAKAHLAQFGQKHFDDAFAIAKEAAAAAQDGAACNRALNGYLQAWRKGHLEIDDTPREQAAHEAAAHSNATADVVTSYRQPSIRLLSGNTLLLTLKSFWSQYRKPLIALLKQHHRDLATHPNWIIDVRENDGGADDTYFPLLPWLMANEALDVNVELLATPANIEGAQQVCTIFAPGDESCAKIMAQRVEKLRDTETGHYVANASADGIYYSRQSLAEKHRPARVAVLIDGYCGSSCEQFLLAVRESFNVKLLGRRTFGALDYANLEPHDLPSGKRVLFYAISRSMRIPNIPVDNIGVLPDIYLPPPANETEREEEVFRTQRWLEGGTLAPQRAGE